MPFLFDNPLLFSCDSLEIICSRPEVRNGKIISGLRPTYNYQNNMVFECNEGYILKGSKLIYCGEDGEWNPPPPTCELNSCPELPNIPNAYWERQNSFLSKKQQMYSIGTTLSYRCHFGYEPASDGPTTLTCQKNLTWTPHIECKGESLFLQSFCISSAQHRLFFS